MNKFSVCKDGKVCNLYVEKDAGKGILRVAHTVASDIQLVTGKRQKLWKKLKMNLHQ